MVKVIIGNYGNRFWYLNDQYHRANGPAIQWSNGKSLWFWYDLQVDEYEHMMLMAQEIANGSLIRKY